MQHKKMKLCAILLLVQIFTCLHAQTLFFKEKNGTQTGIPLSDVQKISFSSGNVIVDKINGVANTFGMSDVRYINFTDLSTGQRFAQKQNSADKLKVYPNPATDFIYISFNSNLGQQTNLEIVSANGSVVLKQIVEGYATPFIVNVYGFPKGLYLCKIWNSEIVETIKFFKQ